LFEDGERAEVGTLYKRVGPEAAYLRGLDLAGAKLGWYVREVIRRSPSKRVFLYCWRGGKRSGSIGSLLDFSGFEASLLTGGYKAYRTYVLESFEREPRKYLVLGGRTGSGKTAVLEALRTMGEQVIDLEALAHHKGSAFGGLGEEPQPTVEQFENQLHKVWAQTDPDRRVWVENESRSIGRVFIPQGFWNQFKSAPLIRLDIPFQERVAYLLRGYGEHPPEALEACLVKLERRMGGKQVKDALAAFRQGDLEGATSVALSYYDHTYDHATSKGNYSAVCDWSYEKIDPVAAAEGLLDLVRQKGW
jgi:tRNA 2-selenouridine synthase